ncbi:hypothetical protein CIT26_01035 [Mesorhizobium temperatum]|uniref:Uncharacterized protein n=1 Tax=Mesorhizobium temperatum TaxID=241416 RepID=A0A271LZ15_9HYPH|nr:hypothetical protein CIT26_01035 [Mesorhizobium temperatum]
MFRPHIALSVLICDRLSVDEQREFSMETTLEVLGFALRSGEKLANRNALGQSDGNRRCWTSCRGQGLMLRGEIAGGDYEITAAND